MTARPNFVRKRTSRPKAESNDGVPSLNDKGPCKAE
jgi:hypothetical protein